MTGCNSNSDLGSFGFRTIALAPSHKTRASKQERTLLAISLILSELVDASLRGISCFGSFFVFSAEPHRTAPTCHAAIFCTPDNNHRHEPLQHQRQKRSPHNSGGYEPLRRIAANGWSNGCCVGRRVPDRPRHFRVRAATTTTA